MKQWGISPSGFCLTPSRVDSGRLNVPRTTVGVPIVCIAFLLVKGKIALEIYGLRVFYLGT